MIVIAGCIFLVTVVSFFALGIHGSGTWKYRSIKRIFVFCRRKGFMLPPWFTKEICWNTWMGAMVASFLAFVLLLMSVSIKNEIHQIMKPQYGEGAVQQELELTWENEEGELGKESIQFQVDEKKLTSEEIDTYMQEIKETLPQLMLGNNKSADHVNQSLNLVEQMESIPADISWISSDTETVNMDGSLGMDIPETGKVVCLTAVIQIQETEDMYVQEIKVYPQKLHITEQIKYWLESENLTADQWIDLPDEWDGMQLSWTKVQTSQWIGIVILLLSCPVFYVLKCRQDYEEKTKDIREQLLLDYPRILNKLTLLLSAGLNVRKAIERIGNDYLKYKKEGDCNWAYEEILALADEMNRGISEKEAYERYGERCQILPYRTLAALLVQYLQKGGDDIQRILEEECKKAQEVRIQQVKIIGEQVSTKLLFPMMIMLVIVFVIVLLPAWISFSV